MRNQIKEFADTQIDFQTLEVLLSAEQIRRLQEHAEAAGVDLSAVICYAIEAWLEPGVHGADGI